MTGERTHRFLAGSVSGMICSGILQPFDVLRTQQQGLFNTPTTSLHSTMRRIYQHQGWRGFYRGTSATLARVSLGAGTYFTTLSTILQTLPSSPQSQFLAGAAARSFAGILLCPLTVVKARMEWNGTYANVHQAFQSIYQTEGFFGLYRGLYATILRDAPFSGLYVMWYAQFKIVFQELQHPDAINFASGLTAGALATLITHPMDTMKTRLQLPGPPMALRHAILRICREEGLSGMYRGFVPRMSKRVLSTALTWTLFERIALWCGQGF